MSRVPFQTERYEAETSVLNGAYITRLSGRAEWKSDINNNQTISSFGDLLGCSGLSWTKT